MPAVFLDGTTFMTGHFFVRQINNNLDLIPVIISMLTRQSD